MFSSEVVVFLNTFLERVIRKIPTEWRDCKLKDKIRNIESIKKFKVTILNPIRPKGNSVFDNYDTSGLKLFKSPKVKFQPLK